MRFSLTRRHAALIIAGAAAVPLLHGNAVAVESDPLPSWNDGPAKQGILDFVRATTDKTRSTFVAPEQRIATFDQDGTLWVEHPMYTQVVFSLDRVDALLPQHPEWKTTEPFRSVLVRDVDAMAKFTMKDYEKIAAATHTGMTVKAFATAVGDWIAKAKDRRWNRLYTELVYQPMLEVLGYLRANGYKTFIVTGGGQEFVRAYADRVYGIPPEQVIGSALETRFDYSANGEATLTRSPILLLNNNMSGKAEDIYLFIGRQPQAAFGNSTGDQQMLEYTGAGGGARLMMLVFHDDAKREYAYGPAQGLADTKVGAFTQALYDEAEAKHWFVISMKNDWKRLFAFEP